MHLLQLGVRSKEGSDRQRLRPPPLLRTTRQVNDLVVACIRRGLEWFDWDSVRSYFRVLTSLVQLKDSLQTQASGSHHGHATRSHHTTGQVLEDH